jgi:hypothetical protein
MPLTTPSPFIVLGAPRSGTSLAAGALQACGISMGKDLLEPDSGNPHGYFEDIEFINFHRALLARTEDRSESLFDDSTMRERPFNFKPQPEDIKAAQELVDQRIGLNQPWGWKDPRTCLFLPFWAERLPGAHFILTYKHPLETSASILRMGKNWDLALDPTMVVRSWTFYMSETLKFLQQLPKERYFIANANTLISNPDALITTIQDWLQTELDPLLIKEQIHEELTTKSVFSSEVNKRFIHHFPKAARLFKKLEKASPQALKPTRKSKKTDDLETNADGTNLDLENELAYLENQTQPAAAERNNKARRELRENVAKHIRCRLVNERKLNTELKNACIQQDALQEHSERLSIAYEELKEHNEGLSAAYKKLQKQNQDLKKLGGAYKELKEHNESLSTAYKQLQEHDEGLSAAYKELQKQNQDLKKLGGAYKELKEHNESLSTAYKQLQEHDEGLSKAYKELQKHNQDLKKLNTQTTEAFNQKFRENENIIGALTADAKKQKNLLISKEHELQIIQKNHGELDTRLKNTRTQKDALKEHSEKLGKAYKELKEHNEGLSNAYKELQKHNQDLKKLNTETTKGFNQKLRENENTIEALKSRLNIEQQLRERIDQCPCAPSPYDLFGRLEEPSVPPPSYLEKYQVKRSTLTNWKQLQQTTKAKQIWVVDPFSFLNTKTNNNEAPLSEHWRDLSKKISSQGSIGNVSADTILRVYNAIHTEHFQSHPNAPTNRLDSVSRLLANRFEQNQSTADEWSECAAVILGKQISTSEAFKSWLKLLHKKEGQWICTGFHGFSRNTLVKLVEALQLPLQPSDYLCSDSIPADAAIKEYFAHWLKSLDRSDWTNISWLGASLPRDYYWPKQNGIRNCYLLH